MELPKTILVAVDFTPASVHAAEVALGLAKTLGARMVLLHVAPPSSFPEGTRVLPVGAADPVDVTFYVSTEAREKLAATFAHVLVEGVESRSEVRTGHPATTIVQAAAEDGADCIVVGTAAREGFQRLWLGSVAEEVVRHASVPVVVAHRPR